MFLSYKVVVLINQTPMVQHCTVPLYIGILSLTNCFCADQGVLGWIFLHYWKKFENHWFRISLCPRHQNDTSACRWVDGRMSCGETVEQRDTIERETHNRGTSLPSCLSFFACVHTAADYRWSLLFWQQLPLMTSEMQTLSYYSPLCSPSCYFYKYTFVTV